MISGLHWTGGPKLNDPFHVSDRKNQELEKAKEKHKTKISQLKEEQDSTLCKLSEYERYLHYVKGHWLILLMRF